MKSAKTIKNKPLHTGMTDRIRAAARALKFHPDKPETINWFSRNDVFNRAEILVSEQSSFNACWLELRKRGELERMCYQKYRYNEDRAARGGGVKLKIYRAMYIKGAFCAPDIKKLTKAEISYVHGVIRRLVKDGELEFTGCREHFKFYRIKNSERFYLEKVRG